MDDVIDCPSCHARLKRPESAEAPWFICPRCNGRVEMTFAEEEAFTTAREPTLRLVELPSSSETSWRAEEVAPDFRLSARNDSETKTHWKVFLIVMAVLGLALLAGLARSEVLLLLTVLAVPVAAFIIGGIFTHQFMAESLRARPGCLTMLETLFQFVLWSFLALFTLGILTALMVMMAANR